MSSQILHSITITTDAVNGSLIDELLPSIDLYPSSYFDCDDNIARLNLYYENMKDAEDTLKRINEAFGNWVELAGLELSKIEIVRGELKNEDWSEKWKEFFHVEKISERLVIKPSWENYIAEANDVVIEIDPGMSFGTGNHGTTKGCLQLLDKLSTSITGKFLDMGCGSGILSIAASKLGFKQVDGFDYDEPSVKIARENVALSDCENIKLTINDLYKLNFDPEYNLVVANILAPVLIDNSSKISGAIIRSEESRLVLSGILHEQFPEVQQTFENQGLELIEQIKLDKWSTGLFKLKNL